MGFSAFSSYQWTFRRVMWATLVLVSVAFGFWLLYRFHQVIFMLSIAIMLGTVIRPVVTWLHHRGLPQLAGVIAAVVLALILFFAGYGLLAYVLILGVLALWLIVELVKALTLRRRPFFRLTQARIVGGRAGGRSFPSGHTSQAFFMATLLVGYFDLGVWGAVLLYAIALLVGITRIYVGAHYPRDVLAGAILGSAWGLLGGIIFGYAL